MSKWQSSFLQPEATFYGDSAQSSCTSRSSICAKLFRQRTSANAATYKPVVVAVDGPGAAAVIELAPRPGVHQVFFVVWRCIFHLARNMAASKRVPLSWLPISSLLIPLTKAMTWSAFDTLMADLLNAKQALAWWCRLVSGGAQPRRRFRCTARTRSSRRTPACCATVRAVCRSWLRCS